MQSKYKKERVPCQCKPLGLTLSNAGQAIYCNDKVLTPQNQPSTSSKESDAASGTDINMISNFTDTNCLLSGSIFYDITLK